MPTITIQHVDGSDPVQFLVVTTGKNLGPFKVPCPADFAIENLPDSSLIKELRWYLETFLDYPYPPETDRAERVLETLRRWGLAVGEALFEGRETGRLLDRATDDGYAQLELRISSDDPGILQWPWEAVRTTDGGVLSRTCQIKRQLNELRPPKPLSDELPQKCVNILLVTARPMEADVGYRSISRPLVDQVNELDLPAKITVLRPPTLAQLRSHLHEHQNHYHILHFDGHGSYGGPPTHDSRRAFELKAAQGQLIFEDDQGKPDTHDAETLGELLKEYNVPVVVLNACQSAMVDDRAKDAFASVAAALQWSGVRSVVAMAYSLYVSGAQQFLPEFYRRLFENGSVSDAARAGRQKMLERKERICSRGEFKLNDWLVPVVYEQEAVDFSFAKTAQVDRSETVERVPQEAQDSENPYGLVGRDNAILDLERAMRRQPAGILVHGLGGVGKTTVAQGFVRWLAKTDGLANGCFWQSYQDVRSAEFVINQMAGPIFGADALAHGLDEKIQALAKVLKENRFLIIWDNFEVVSGIAAAALQPTLPAADRTLLHQFLKSLRGGLTKVLITSRSQEEWLEPAHCQRISIGGLTGEERWEYCEKIVSDFGVDIDRRDKEWKSLIDLLDGHPLAMRVILPRLATGQTPTQLINGIKQNVGQFQGDDADSAKLFATMGFAQDNLPEELRPLLIPLALHERFVVTQLFHGIAQSAAPEFGEIEIGRFLSSLSMAGLLREVQSGIFEVHPTLTRFLELSTKQAYPEQTQSRWQRAFVDQMARVADQYATKPLHEQRGVFHLLGTCFMRARELSAELDQETPFAALTQSLAAYAQNTRNWEDAVRLFEDFAQRRRNHGDSEGEAAGYHQLGVIAALRRDVDTAANNFTEAMRRFRRFDIGHENSVVARSYRRLYDQAPPDQRPALLKRWKEKDSANFQTAKPRRKTNEARGNLDRSPSSRKNAEAVRSARRRGADGKMGVGPRDGS